MCLGTFGTESLIRGFLVFSRIHLEFSSSALGSFAAEAETSSHLRLLARAVPVAVFLL